MTLLDRLDLLKAKTGDNNSTLAKNSGIPYTTIDGLYKKDFHKMYLSTLEKLCDYFGVSLDWLVKGETGETLSREEIQLIADFRKLNEKGRANIAAVVEGLSGNPEMQKDTAKEDAS